MMRRHRLVKTLQDGDSEINVVIATSSAFGTGIDTVNCNSVILYGTPSSITNLVQEV